MRLLNLIVSSIIDQVESNLILRLVDLEVILFQLKYT
jgi:hypothetical protein